MSIHLYALNKYNTRYAKHAEKILNNLQNLYEKKLLICKDQGYAFQINHLNRAYLNAWVIEIDDIDDKCLRMI